MTTDLTEMAARIGAARPSGTLRVYSDWFGRPFDNQHRVVSATIRDGKLVIGLDQDDELLVENPTGLTIGDGIFRIDRADRVRLEWFAYGRPHEAENRYWQEHWLEDGRVRAAGGVDWFAPSFSPSLEFPAVELLEPSAAR